LPNKVPRGNVPDCRQEAAEGGLFFLQEGAIAMKTWTHFSFRVDTWTADGENIVEHVAGIEDHQVTLATYRAACERWPGTALRRS